MDIIKSPQENIEAFLVSDLNIEIYKDLSCIGSLYQNDSELLKIFNLLFERLNLFIENSQDYRIVTSTFENVFLEDLYSEVSGQVIYDKSGQRVRNNTHTNLMLYTHRPLIKLIEEYLLNTPENNIAKKAFEHIVSLVKSLEKERNFNSSFDGLKLGVESKDLEHQILMWTKLKYNYQKMISGNEIKDDEILRVKRLVKQIDVELKRLKNIKKFDKGAQQPETDPLEKPVSQPNENTLQWKGTQLEFAELVKALKESNKVSPELSQKELFRRMKQLFNIDEFNENDKLKDIRIRTRDLTPLITTLETALTTWIKTKD